VAKLLLADPRSFATLPVSELADRAHVSKPTVVRFCRSVGYDGLADFKLKLAGTVNEGVPFVHRAVDEDDKPGDLIVKVIDNAVAALLKYRNNAAGHAFEQAPWPLVTAAGQAGAHRVLRRGQLGHRGAGRAAQVLPPGRACHRGERRPRAGDGRHHAGPG
jgi:RpiR family carbohydrate utilization transcriptional regulator